MNKIKQKSKDLFLYVYLSVVQIMIKLLDPTFVWGEVGRGSGKTTEMLASRIDRVQNDMPGALLVLGAATYKSILENILPGVLEYFLKHYKRGLYFEYGVKPPAHFGVPTMENPEWNRREIEKTVNWKHTLSFVNGTVIRFVSCDRPESMLGLSAAHLFLDEMIRIPKDKFLERIIPALRADRSKFGHSHYFMGITGFSSTPNFETDEDWWTEYETNMNVPLMQNIIKIAYEVDVNLGKLFVAQANLDHEKVKKHQAFVNRWTPRLNKARRGQTLYLRASSFSNIKILGIEYIRNQIKSLKDSDKLNTSIFSIRKHKVKDMFFGRFGKKHLFDDSYKYTYMDRQSAGSNMEFTSRDLKYCKTNQPLIASYDPGPFSSMVFSQEDKGKKELRVLKQLYVWHPKQHPELAKEVAEYFKYHQKKEIFLYYDRAANQKDPEYRNWYPLNGTVNDTDANLLAAALRKEGFRVHLLSKGQETIFYSQHYQLLNILFGDNDGTRDDILIDKNECEALISSIHHSPIKINEKRLELDKSSERLPFEQQAYYSTQISSAFMYLLWGRYNHLLPASARRTIIPAGAGTYMSD